MRWHDITEQDSVLLIIRWKCEVTQRKTDSDCEHNIFLIVSGIFLSMCSL